MSKVSFKGEPVMTVGELPETGDQAPNFRLIKSDLSEVSLDEFKGKKVVLNIFPSIDTPVCATSVRRFNEEAGKLKNSVVLCISKDLPFAHARFCGAEGLDDVISVSDFQSGSFGEKYGVTITEGPLKGLLSRAVVIVDEAGKVIYSQQVSEITDEPDYTSALAVLE